MRTASSQLCSHMRGNSSAVWWVALLAVILFGGYLYWLKNHSAQERAIFISPKKPSSTQSEGQDAFQFDFFSVLPSENFFMQKEKPPEAVKPIEPTKSKSAETSKTDTTQQTNQIPQTTRKKQVVRQGYVIQLGAFRNRKTADAYKAKLAFLGISGVRMEESTDRKGALFRVNVGSYQTFADADRMQKRLKKHGYNSFLKKFSTVTSQ